MKDGAPRGGMHEADEGAPREAMLDRGQRALAVNTPDLVQDGLEANAMLVDRPELNLRVREGDRHLPQHGAQVGPKLGLGHRVSPSAANWAARGAAGVSANERRALAGTASPVGGGPDVPDAGGARRPRSVRTSCPRRD